MPFFSSMSSFTWIYPISFYLCLLFLTISLTLAFLFPDPTGLPNSCHTACSSVHWIIAIEVFLKTHIWPGCFSMQSPSMAPITNGIKYQLLNLEVLGGLHLPFQIYLPPFSTLLWPGILTSQIGSAGLIRPLASAWVWTLGSTRKMSGGKRRKNLGYPSASLWTGQRFSHQSLHNKCGSTPGGGGVSRVEATISILGFSNSFSFCSFWPRASGGCLAQTC